MNPKRLSTLARTAAIALLGIAAAQAQTPLNYEPGDLFMGFRATAGDGAPKCYLVNLGQAATYTGATSAFQVMNLGNIKGDLDATFPDWATQATVFWSVSGTVGSFSAVGSDPARTLYATKVQAVPGTVNGTGTRWTRNSTTIQGVVTSKMNGMADYYEFVDPGVASPVRRNSTTNSAKALLQNITDVNSYASYQTGGTPANSGPAPGISFAYFNPTIEATFENGVAGSILELYRLAPGTAGTPGDFVGTFQLDANANLTFTPTPTAQVNLSSATYSGSETGGMITVTLSRTGNLSGGFAVNFSTEDGTALAGTDFTGQTNTVVNFAASDTSKTVDVLVTNRTGFQGDRSFSVNLSGATNAAKILTPGTATVTILEAETGVQFDSATYTVSEAGGNVAVKLTRVGAAAAFTATVNTSNGSALAGTDYTVQTSVGVDFLVSDTEKTLNIPVANRAGVQGSRDFTVAITGTTNGVATGTPGTTTVTINDLLVPGTLAFSAATYQQAEPATGTVALTITVNRTGGSDGAASVNVAVGVAGSTATAPDDYTVTASPALLSWASGESGAKTFDITIKADAVAEGTAETILLALQNAVGATLDTPNTATVTLPGEDAVKPAVTVTAPRNNARVTASEVTFSGTATDNVGVARVEVSIAGGALLGMATNAGGTASFNWSLDSIVPEQGANVIEVRAFDTAGNASDSSTINLTFTNLRPQLAGKYNGLLVNPTAAELFNRNGLVQIKVLATGKFTGKMTIAGTKVPLSGVFLSGGAARFGRTLTASQELLKSGASLGFLTLTIDTGGGLEITGALKDAGATTLANVSADLAVYTPRANPTAPLKNVPISLRNPAAENGKYTAVLAPDAVVAGTPAGSGAGTLSISPAGVVKFVGKLADGSPVSYSNALSTDNRWPVFMQPYAKQGFVAGEVSFDPMDAETDAEGALTWFKPAGLAGEKLYPNGWPSGIGSNFMASKYLKPGPLNAGTVLGAGVPGAPDTATANLEIALGDGGLTTDTSNDASIDARSKVTVLGATAGQTAATNLKATFVTGTGALNGSFTHPGSNKTVKFSGAVLQKTSNAFGHFLYLPTTGTAEAGAVGVVEK